MSRKKSIVSLDGKPIMSDKKKKEIEKKQDDWAWEFNKKGNIFLYFFFGLSLLFFGKNIEKFFTQISSIQETGILLVLVGIIIYSITSIKSVSLFSSITLKKIIVAISGIILFFTIANYPMNENIIICAMISMIFLIQELITIAYVSWLKYLETTKSTTEAITTAIAIFAIIISLIALFK